MSIFSARNNQVSGFEEAFNVKDVTSGAMRKAILTWFDLYFNADGPPDEDRCQRLPYVVVNKLYKAAFSEYEAAVTAEGGKPAFMAGVLAALGGVKKKAMQLALIGGEVFLKPVPVAGGLSFSVLRRDCYLVLARDGFGRPTAIGCMERSAAGNLYYTLLERRTIGADGRLTIESRLFRSTDRGTMGSQVPLATLPQYAWLQPSVTLAERCGLGMALLKVPMENCVDGSEDGVAVYAPAVGLIRNINRNEQQINGEFERGASRIIASADMLEIDPDGKRRSLRDHVFTAVDEAPDDIGITIFSPALREASYLARKTEYLRSIETQIGFKRGILSEVEAAERTATEITSGAGDYNLTIMDFQQMWEGTVREALGICDALGRMYKLCGSTAFDPEKDVTIDWGDGVLFDRDKAWAERKEQVASGMLKPELALAWYYNLPHETPKDLKKIRMEYMPELEALTGGE